MAPEYTLEWARDPSALLDYETIEVKDEDGRWHRCLLRFVPPFQRTMRPPSEELSQTLDEIVVSIREPLDRLARYNVAFARGEARDAERADVGMEQLMNVGYEISEMMTVPYVQNSLVDHGLFIDLGTDENLLHFPFELLYDGDEFLCLKHFPGRYINLSTPSKSQATRWYRPGDQISDLRALVISVPEPTARENAAGDVVERFERLDAAESEVESMKAVLREAGIKFDELMGRDARQADLSQLLRENSYHLIHYAGHAQFVPEEPRRSSIALYDRDVNVGALLAKLRKQDHALLCFVNGCETARGTAEAAADDRAEERADDDLDESTWDQEYNLFGLARAFLETGSNFLGSRWRLGDDAASGFADTFYRSLLLDGEAIGRAVTMARQRVKEEAADGDYSWASYVLYGDPRLRLRRSVEEDLRAARLAIEEAQVESPIAEPDRARLEAIAAEYESVRDQMESGRERTARMDELIREVSVVAPDGAGPELISELFGGSEGERVVAISLIHASGDTRHLPMLLESIEDSYSAFEQYHALGAVRRQLGALSSDEMDAVVTTALRVSSRHEVSGTDRGYLIEEILEKLRTQGARLTFWRPGQTLKVAFLDGDASWRETVAEAAAEWSRYANIDFTFDSPVEESEIRITSVFTGYWSFAGRDALRVPPTEPTACLPDHPEEDQEVFRAAALRAFGTVLGLANEHQLEGAKIPWDKEAVYRSYEGPPNNWSRETVDQVIFAQHIDYYPFDKEFDRASIMMMDVPNDLTEGDFEIEHNRELSEGDKEFIARLYPHDVTATR